MMLPQCSHITRKRGIYYYRRRIPSQPRREVAVSLKTRRLCVARWLAGELDRVFGRIIANVNEIKKTADIQSIARQYLKRHLDSDMQVRISSPNVGVYSRSTDRGRIVADDLEWIDCELATAQTELAERLYDHQRPLLNELMAEHGVPAEQRNELAFAIFRANVERWQIVRKRTLGELDPISTPTVEATNGHPAPAETKSSQASPLFSEVLPGFLKFMEETKGWRGQTRAQNETTYRMFIECCGDRPVSDYQRRDLSGFYDTLRALPALYAKSRQWRGLPLSEIVAQTKDVDLQRVDLKTVKRHFAALGRLFSYLKRRGEITGENPAHGFEFPKQGRARSKRSMWSAEMLAKLFKSPVWTGCSSEARRSWPGKLIIKDEKYWLPLLGVYHGNRLEEFSQLVRSDIRCEDGIWFFDINDEDGKQVKNEQSKRRVPLHPALRHLGFLEYVESTAPNPTDRVFQQLRPGGPDQKLGFYFSKWWAQYRKDVGVYEKGLDYHSFRATVATKLAEAEVSLEVRNELLGHEGKSIDEQNYQKGFSLKFLAEAISRVSWPDVKL
jgi:site-specific recombinase XerD